MRETLPLLKLYKTLIIIGIVVGPIYWLMFTSDGKLRTDSMVLWLAGGESIDLNLKALDGQYREDEWRQIYPDLSWNCKSTESSLGNQVCYAEIASYNRVPSSYLSVFFKYGRTSALKLVYRDQYHKEIGEDLLTQLGQPDTPTQANKGVIQWTTLYGVVLLKEELQRGEEPVLIWLAAGRQ